MGFLRLSGPGDADRKDTRSLPSKGMRRQPIATKALLRGGRILITSRPAGTGDQTIALHGGVR